jgi:cytochrome c553
MNRTIRFTTALGLVLMLCQSHAGAQPASDTQIHMREHLARLNDIKAALLIGELANAREPATWLAEHEPLEDLPLIYEGFVLSLREHARDILDAKDVKSASIAMAAVANDCGRCHRATGTKPDFGFYREPPSWSDLASHMQRHEWAIDRLWEGLMGPSNGSWARGVRMLAEAPLHGTENTWGESQAEGDELAERVHELGIQAVSALTPDARADVYGEMIATCAACHARTGGGPRSY